MHDLSTNGLSVTLFLQEVLDLIFFGTQLNGFIHCDLTLVFIIMKKSYVISNNYNNA